MSVPKEGGWGHQSNTYGMRKSGSSSQACIAPNNTRRIPESVSSLSCVFLCVCVRWRGRKLRRFFVPLGSWGRWRGPRGGGWGWGDFMKDQNKEWGGSDQGFRIRRHRRVLSAKRAFSLGLLALFPSSRRGGRAQSRLCSVNDRWSDCKVDPEQTRDSRSALSPHVSQVGVRLLKSP